MKKYINNTTIKTDKMMWGRCATIELIGYDGWEEGKDTIPSCGGSLVIKINNYYYLIEHALESGGRYYYDEECEGYIVEHGDWLPNEENFPEECIDLIDEIMELVNKNIPKGCCGGCT